MTNKLVIVRGGGDLSTAVIQKLHRSGYRVLVLERRTPSFVRRNVSLANAVYEGQSKVEDITGVQIDDLDQAQKIWDKDHIPIIVDESARTTYLLRPLALVDAIIAKKNIGTNIDMADITIGLGPGFVAGKDVHVVIETQRGHDLGRVIYEGSALENTGIPGNIKGVTKDRLFRSPVAGKVQVLKDIGSVVDIGQLVAIVEGHEVRSKIKGLIRGMIRNDTYVGKGQKIGDIDPRIDLDNIDTISDKGRNIAGGVLEAIVTYENKKGRKESEFDKIRRRYFEKSL